MLDHLAIFLGGGLGAVFRNFIFLGVSKLSLNAWAGTLIVNIIGSLLIISLGEFIKELASHYSSFLKVGILGGLTTFSALAFDVFSFVREGSYLQALLIISLNIFFGIVVGVILFK